MLLIFSVAPLPQRIRHQAICAQRRCCPKSRGNTCSHHESSRTTQWNHHQLVRVGITVATQKVHWGLLRTYETWQWEGVILEWRKTNIFFPMKFSGQFRGLHSIFNSHCGQLRFRMQESQSWDCNFWLFCFLIGRAFPKWARISRQRWGHGFYIF